MNNWNPDYKGAVEETTEDIGPMKDLGDYEDDNIHVVEDEKTNDTSWDNISEEEFEKMLLEEEEVEEMKHEVETVEVKEEKKVATPVLTKTNHRNIKTSKLDFSRSTGGSRLSRLIGRDNDVQL